MANSYNTRGWFLPAFHMGRKHLKRILIDKDFRFLQSLHSRFGKWPRFQSGSCRYHDRDVSFGDAASFLNIWDEVFVNGIYDLGDLPQPPRLIDAGANIGLAAIYMKHRYGHVEGVCFEPDSTALQHLRKNLSQWEIDMEIVPKALGAAEGQLPFSPDNADGGRLHVNSPAVDGDLSVPVTTLSKYLKGETVDLLKIDIEGAEADVLEEIEPHLDTVNNAFVEVHDFTDSPPVLGRVVGVLERAGFRLALRESVAQTQPYDLKAFGSDNNLTMAVNIFASRPGSK